MGYLFHHDTINRIALQTITYIYGMLGYDSMWSDSGGVTWAMTRCGVTLVE